MLEIALFIAALFLTPWLIDLLVPPPGNTLGLFLVVFIPVVREDRSSLLRRSSFTDPLT